MVDSHFSHSLTDDCAHHIKLHGLSVFSIIIFQRESYY